MKFRFCGDQDCPDWLLAEMSTLSRLTSIKTKLVTAQVVQSLIKGNINSYFVAENVADYNNFTALMELLKKFSSAL